MSVSALAVGAITAGLVLALAMAAMGPHAPPRVEGPRTGRVAGAILSRMRPWVAPTVAALSAGAVSPLLAPLTIGATILRRHLSDLRARRAQASRMARDVPTALDLLALCTSAGFSLPLAHRQVAERAPGDVGRALAEAAAAADRGLPRADALVSALAPLGSDARAVADLLADHLRYGTSLGPGLERLALELRLASRRRVEEEARRIPVRLLGPLVLCVLPAFALLTVVPLLVASLEALPL